MKPNVYQFYYFNSWIVVDIYCVKDITLTSLNVYSIYILCKTECVSVLFLQFI